MFHKIGTILGHGSGRLVEILNIATSLLSQGDASHEVWPREQLIN